LKEEELKNLLVVRDVETRIPMNSYIISVNLQINNMLSCKNNLRMYLKVTHHKL